MLEWFLSATKVYIIGFGIFFVIVTAIVLWIVISVLRDMKKMDREFDKRWKQ